MPRGLFRNKPTNCWRAKIKYPDGTTRALSTRMHDFHAALVAKNRMQREAVDPSYVPCGRIPLHQVLTGFLSAREVSGGRAGAGCAPATLGCYREKCAALERGLGAELNVQALRLSDLEAYIVRRRVAGVCDHTIAKELGILRAALRRARQLGRWRGQFEQVFPAFRPAYTPRRRFLEPAEYHRLLDELRPDRRLAVAFLVLSGARLGEWAALERRHVDLVAGVVTLPGTKTIEAHRQLPVSDELAAVLELALEEAPAEGRLFPRWSNIQRDLASACRRAGVTPVTPNDLRRTFATWCWRGGIQPAEIARLLGHRNARMVEQVYGQLRAIDLAGKVQAAIRAIHQSIVSGAVGGVR